MQHKFRISPHPSFLHKSWAKLRIITSSKTELLACTTVPHFIKISGKLIFIGYAKPVQNCAMRLVTSVMQLFEYM